jgi:hypothetical protein
MRLIIEAVEFSTLWATRVCLQLLNDICFALLRCTGSWLTLTTACEKALLDLSFDATFCDFRDQLRLLPSFVVRLESFAGWTVSDGTRAMGGSA